MLEMVAWTILPPPESKPQLKQDTPEAMRPCLLDIIVGSKADPRRTGISRCPDGNENVLCSWTRTAKNVDLELQLLQ